MNKYRNKKTIVDGISFDSMREAARYGELRLLEKTAEICDLELQPKFPIVINGVKVCTYIADFKYEEYSTVNILRTVVVEDVKGMKTPMYNLKKKLMRAVHCIEIREIT